ncbi:energy transducer TonB [Thermocrinis sp.]|uniref:energy transducer TonB n=1 Tax=Thermocrinis sp. TaxID=2024383 RepID=UPI002FDEF985
MRELVKAYSLSFLIHFLLVFGLLFLTQRMPFLEKRIVEIDLSFENLKLEKEIVAEKNQKQAPSRHAEPLKAFHEDKTLNQEEKTAQIQTVPQEKQPITPTLSPVRDEPEEDRASQVQSIAEGKPADTSPSSSANQRVEIEEKKATAQVVGTQSSEGSKHAEESRKASLEESFLKEKLSVISGIVQRYANYPPIARRMGWEGKVLISFVLEPSGEIRDLKILKGSGYEVLDREALEAIKRSYREFPKPPASVIVRLPVAFRLE